MRDSHAAREAREMRRRRHRRRRKGGGGGGGGGGGKTEKRRRRRGEEGRSRRGGGKRRKAGGGGGKGRGETRRSRIMAQRPPRNCASHSPLCIDATVSYTHLRAHETEADL
eukprot:3548589-Rhodomonas_salina.1